MIHISFDSTLSFVFAPLPFLFRCCHFACLVQEGKDGFGLSTWTVFPWLWGWEQPKLMLPAAPSPCCEESGSCLASLGVQTVLPPTVTQEMLIMRCLLEPCLAHFPKEQPTASEHRAPRRLLVYRRRWSVSIFHGSSINVWLRFNSFLPSLGISTLRCQEAIYPDYFKDIVNICCCTHIKQEVLVLRTEVRLLLALAV